MKTTAIDGNLYKKMMINAANELEKNKADLNALNVFPVPDGDTGTNMSLTFMAAVKELTNMNTPKIGDITKSVSSGALRGARGNSGVILSQLCRGFNKGLKDIEVASIDEFANALVEGKEAAYKAVMKPKEGTILTVATAVAESAMLNKDNVKSVEELLTEIIKDAETMLEKTKEMLPVLKQADVVDAGAKGYIYILKGMLKGLSVSEENSELISINDTEDAKMSAMETINPDDIKFAYCTEFLIILDDENSESIENTAKTFLNTIGDSIVVVKDEEVLKVHVHTNNPGAVLERAVRYGYLDNIKIENMKIQHTNMLNFSKQSEEEMEYKEVAIIAVSVGEGVSEILTGLGVDAIVSGGQSMNPSTEDFCTVIDKLNCDKVIIYPNNSNIIMAAEQTKTIVENKEIFVIPTKNIPQAVTSLINYMPADNIEDTVQGLIDSIELVKSGEVTHAVRTTEIDGVKIQEGDYLLINGKRIINTSTSLIDGTVDLIADMVEDEQGFVTIYYGEDVTEEDATAVANKVMEEYPDVEVDVQNGGQPVYYFIVSVE